jgi:hypothetical protein
MLSVLTALLLAGAEPSSYGFSVAWNSDSSLVHHARGYADNVVNISMNDLTTMRNTELEEVHPRGPAVLTNMPDNNPNTTGQNPLSTTDDQPPRLDHDTSVVHHHANDPNSMNHEMLCFRMDNQHGPHTLDGLRPRAPHTTLLRPAQRLGNDPDASHAYICLASPCVHRSHHAIAAPAVSVELGYTNANAICVVTTFHSKSNGTGDGYNEDHNTASPCVHRSHHAIAAPAVSVELSCAIAAPAKPVELSCAIAAPAKPVELSCAIAAPDLSVELGYAVGLPAHGHYSTQHHEVSAYCLDNNTSTPTPMITPMRTPASTPAAPIAALDTRIAPTQPPPSPNVMMTTTLDNLSMTGSAMSDPLRPVRRGCSDTGHTATALCTCNVHRLAAPNANINKSMTTTRSGRRPPSTHNVALPVALLLPSGTTQQIESDLTSIVASDPTTITAGPSLWPSQSRSTECREGPPNQAPADHANVLTYLARRGSRYSLQCTLCWHFSWTLAFLAPHAAHRALLSPPAACLGQPAAHYASPSPPATRLLALPSTGYPSPSPPATRLLGLPSAGYASPSLPATYLLALLSARHVSCAVYYPPPRLRPARPASPSPPSPLARAVYLRRRCCRPLERRPCSCC